MKRFFCCLVFLLSLGNAATSWADPDPAEPPILASDRSILDCIQGCVDECSFFSTIDVYSPDPQALSCVQYCYDSHC
jgi:hypothetical protein